MTPATVARIARPIDDRDTIRRIRAAMARHGLPVDDLSDAEIRRRATGLTGGRPDALERIARALEAPPDDDD
jgi:hypothetical protein